MNPEESVLSFFIPEGSMFVWVHMFKTQAAKRLPRLRPWDRYCFCVFFVGTFFLISTGCATQKYVQMRSTPNNPLTESLDLLSRTGPKVTQRTTTLLRHYALLDLYKTNPEECLVQLQELAMDEKGAEKVYAISELAYTIGSKAEKASKEGSALDMYTVAVSNAYLYLFCPELDVSRNPYDPQFRGACDLYNTALEATLRLVSKQGNLKPGNSYRISTSKKDYDVQVVSRGAWHEADFESLKFCSDFQVKGLESANLSYGVGVPMIAVPQTYEQEILSARLAEFGAGLMLLPAEVTRETLRAAVGRILADGAFDVRAQQLALASREAGGAARAADAILHYAERSRR